MKQRSKHKIQKDLDREQRHRTWLEKNLKGTLLLKRNKQKILELHKEKQTHMREL